MARPVSNQQRTLTMMEELEKLEQSITMTLQEIDHNFSRAHRIVTSQILPVVDEFAKHSENLWENSKFWKQFFEASANVSLNSYEEPTATEETLTDAETTTTQTDDPSTSSYLSTPSQTAAGDGPGFTTPASNRTFSTFHGDESPNFDTPQATPRAAAQPTARVASYASPYEKIRREVQGSRRERSTPSTVPSTPLGQTMSENPDEDDDTILARPSTAKQRAGQKSRTPANDPLMHRVLDKNYRIQATPHSQVRLPARGAGAMAKTPITGRKVPARSRLADLDSSPMMEAPKLNAEIFTSPYKAPRVPGISVMTPAKHTQPSKEARNGDGGQKAQTKTASASASAWDSDSDEGFSDGYSPPKTIQFHIPQSKLLKTPGKCMISFAI